MQLLDNDFSSPVLTYANESELQPGNIYALPNDSRFEAGNLSVPLTAYATGWRDPYNYLEMLEWVAPAVQVGGNLFEFKKTKNNEMYVTETEASVRRAIGADFGEVEYTGEKARERVYNKGLRAVIDEDDETFDGQDRQIVSRLMDRLVRIDLRAAIGVLGTAASAAIEKTWNGSANPKKDLRDAARLAKNETGMRPNKLLFGGPAYDLWQDSYESQETAGAFASAGRTPDEIARGLNLAGGGRVSEEVYQSSNTAKAEIVGNYIFMFFAESGLMKDDPSNIKRFVRNTKGGGAFAVYVEKKPKRTFITVEHYSNIVATATVGLRRLLVAAS